MRYFMLLVLLASSAILVDCQHGMLAAKFILFLIFHIYYEITVISVRGYSFGSVELY